MIRGEAFEAALNEFCAGDDPARLRLLATYGAAGLRRMLTTVYETLRSAGRELALELGERPGLEARLAELAEAARCLAEDAGRNRRCARGSRAGARPDGSPAAARAAARSQRPAGTRRARCDLRGSARRGRAGGARRARAARPRAAAGAPARLCRGVRGREGSRVGARLRGSPAPRARPAAGERDAARARAAAFPLDHGRRVPGHEPTPVRAGRSCSPARTPSGSSSATSSSRSTASGTRTCRSSGSGARRPTRCCR